MYEQFFERNFGVFTPEEQQRVRDARVVIVGCGGIGGLVAVTLARSGLEHFVLYEYDTYQPFGVEAFCTVCKKCAENCPSQSIPYGDKTREGHNISNQSGVLKWYSNLERCYAFWSKNRMSCADCIRVCPFNKPMGMIHYVTRSMIRFENSILNRFFVWVDDIMRYDKPYSATRFWDSA